MNIPSRSQSGSPLRSALPLLAVIAGVSLMSARGLAQATPNPPARMTYQGFLVGSDGVALGNAAPKNYDVIFTLYNSETASASANILWGEQQTVTVDKGYFSILLGEGAAVNGLAHTDLSGFFKGADASDRYVGITVKGIGAGGANVDITPRLRLLTSPYAFLAQQAVKLVQGTGADLITANGNTVTVSGPTTVSGTLAATGALSAPSASISGPLSATGTLTAGATTINGTLTTTGALTAPSASVSGTVTAGTFAGNGTIPIGGIIMWSGSTPPAGWALCNGLTVNGITTPNLQGRFVLGSGTGGGLTPRSVGQFGGSETVTLGLANIPAHTHTVSVNTVGYTSSYNGSGEATGAPLNPKNNSSQSFTTSSAGSGSAFGIMPPYYVLAFIMRVQ